MKLEILKVWPEKLVYLPNAQAHGVITLGNGTANPATVTLKVSQAFGFDSATPIATQQVTLSAGAVREIPMTWKVGTREFGRELCAELLAADGAVLDRKGEFFAVGSNNYRLGQCRLIRPWTWDKGDTTLPGISPEDRWYGNHFEGSMPPIRRLYATVTEYFFWGPDDFGNLTPTIDEWYSGQAQYFITQADVHAVNDAAHANGIKTVTYGKKWMAVDGLYSKLDGVELTRMHPEWAEWHFSGNPKWTFDLYRYAWTYDQVRTLITQQGRNDQAYCTGLVAVNGAESDCVRYGAEEIVRSAKKYGWDGVRFDDHWTLDAVFDGGLNIDGSTTERGGDYEKMTADNVRMSRAIWAKYNPDFLVGYNYALSYDGWGIRQPEAYVETCKDGQFIMLEHSIWLDSWAWPKMMAVLAMENHRVQRLGGVPGEINPNAGGLWSVAANFAGQGHYYNVPNIPGIERYNAFMLRYGEVYYDPKTVDVPDPDPLVKVTPAEKVVYRDYLYQRTLDDKHRQLILGLINNPGTGTLKDTRLPVPPVEQVTVTFTIPLGWKAGKVWYLDPDSPTPCVPITGKADGDKLTITIPKLVIWNTLVVELSR